MTENELPDESDRTPVSKRKPDDQFAVLKQWILEDQRGNSRWYKEAVLDYDFEAGKQWSEDEVSTLDGQQRLHVTFNRVKPTVDVICGMEVTNRQEVKFLPRTTASPIPEVDPQTGQPIPPQPGADDAEVNEGLSEVGRWARDNCNAEDEESDSFRDTTICGMGWTETRMDYEADPEGQIIIERVDPLEMVWDCTAKKRNVDDARRLGRIRKDISIDEARSMFPDISDSDLHASWVSDGYEAASEIDHDRERARSYGNRNGAKEEPRKNCTLVEIQWFEVETAYQVLNPADGSTFEVDKKKLDKLKQLEGQPGPDGMPIQITSAPIKKRCWYRAFLGAKLLGKVEKAPCESRASYRAITGYRDRNAKQWYGIVRHMRDPQKWANKLFSVALEQIATSGKGLMAEQGAFVDDKKAEQEWAKTGNIAWLKPGGITRVLPKPQPPLLSGLSDLMALSLAGIRDTTGVNQETLGATDRSQAASLEYQRTKQASVILAALFDSLRLYRKEQGRVLLYFIQNYISDGRLVRVLGDQGKPKVLALIRSPETVEYDVIVDEAPSSPNQKEAGWLVSQQILPPLLARPDTPVEVLMEFVRSSPLPESAFQRLQKAYQKAQEQRAQQGPSVEEQKLQAEVQKTQADARKSDAEGQLKMQELQLRKYEADLNAATTMQTLQAEAEQRQHEMGMRQFELQNAEKTQQHEMTMRQYDIAGRQQDMEIEKVKADAANEQETTKAVGPKLPELISGIGKGFEALAKATEAGQQALAAALVTLAESNAQVAKAVSAPKMAKLSPDGLSATIQ